jgi:hypothetical protein
MSGIRVMFVKFQELPQPIRLSTIGYLGSILVYNAAAAYVDSADAIAKFQKGELTKEPYTNGKPINTKWEAAKYGANKNFCENLWNSLIWPAKTVSKIVPMIAVGLN